MNVTNLVQIRDSSDPVVVVLHHVGICFIQLIGAFLNRVVIYIFSVERPKERDIEGAYASALALLERLSSVNSPIAGPVFISCENTAI